MRKPCFFLKSYRAPLTPGPERVPGAGFGSSRGSGGTRRGARTRLLPASTKSVRKVERRGKTAGPVAGQRSVYLNDIKDSLLGVGFTRETNGPANVPFFIKNILLRYSSERMK